MYTLLYGLGKIFTDREIYRIAENMSFFKFCWRLNTFYWPLVQWSRSFAYVRRFARAY